MPEPTIPESVFDRYLAGEATPDEVRQMLGVPEADVAGNALISALEPVASEIATPQVALHRFHTAREQKLSAHPAPQQRTLRARWAGVAVACVAIIGVTYVGVSNSWIRIPPTNESQRAHISEYRTVAGQRARIVLDDGSSVVLGPQSTLEVVKGFGASHRTVTLSGQGLFTVTHQGTIPFTVAAGGISTKVLGTSFMVRRYREDSLTNVVVAQGRVSVGNTVLGTGMMAHARSSSQVEVVRNVPVARALSWVDGELVLDEVPLRGAAIEMERWYGIKIVIRDTSLLEKRVMTTLGMENMRESLSLVATALDARVTFTNNTVIFGR